MIELDANAKLGKQHIKKDPHDMTENGRLLVDILGRQNLTIVNKMDICEGTITRERITKDRIERSVIDYVIICCKMIKFVKSMLIDEKRIHVLKKYASKKGVKKHKLSDYNILFCKFSIQVEELSSVVRKEFFQLKNKEDQRKFLDETSIVNKLTSSFSENLSFSHCANIFFKKLKNSIHKCFKKICIKSGSQKYPYGDSLVQEKLMMKRKLGIFLKNNTCPDLDSIVKEKLDEIDNFLTET